MSFSQEFFSQRSFEVVWAIFRVAERFERKALRILAEDRALEYLARKDRASIRGLEEIVKLSVNIGEMSETNANVLSREITRLRGIIEEMTATHPILESGKSPAKDKEGLNIEGMFSRPPMLISEIIKEISDKYIKDNIVVKKEVVEVGVENKGVEKSGKEVRQESGKSPAMPNAGSIAASQIASDQSNKRKGVIMEILGKKTLCHIKDFVLAMPNVSERTIRYDIQRMARDGVIERVGSGGPNSFLRLKKG